MELYRVFRTDEVDYGEFIEAVVRAESRVQALVLIGGKYGVKSDFSNVSVEQVPLEGEAWIICESWQVG